MVGVTQDRPNLRVSSARAASDIFLSPPDMTGETAEAQKDPSINHGWTAYVALGKKLGLSGPEFPHL